MSAQRKKDSQNRNEQQRKHYRLIRWAELIGAVARLRRLINAAERDGVIDEVDANNALQCLECVKGDLVEAVPTE